MGGLQNEQSLLLTQICFHCKRKWFVGLFECFFGQVSSKVMWTQKHCFSRSIWSLLFDVNQLLSQKCRSRFSKANFYSKTVGSVFSVFVLQSTSFPIILIIFVWRQSFTFSEMKVEALKSQLLLKDSEHNIYCFLPFFHHFSQSIDYFCLLSINYFLRNAARNSQNRTFGRRQWAQYLLFLFFT